MPADRTGGSKPLPPPVSGLAKDDERRAIDPDALELDDAAPERAPVTPVTLPAYPGADARAREPNRPNLEPIAEQAHPAKNRRIPTQPPAALALDVDPPEPAPVSEPLGYVPPPPTKTIIRQSPAPIRRYLFSIDRPTSLLAGLAIGLLLAVYPAKKLAQSYEIAEVEPMLAELDKSVAQTLAVEAGLVESPESVAARIHAGRKKVRQRFMLVWLLMGVPIGVGLGLAPRPGD